MARSTARANPQPQLLVATWNDGLFALSGNQVTREIADQPIGGLASDGQGGAIAIAAAHSLLRRGSAGEWMPLASSRFELSCCMAVHGVIYVGTDDARMLRLNARNGELEPLEGFDRIESRHTWFAGSAVIDGQRVGPPLGIRSVAANAGGTVLFANVHVGGIPRSLDGGNTWQPTIDIEADVHEVRAHPSDPAIVAAAAAAGLCISLDAGQTWIVEREALHAPHCAAVAFSGNDIIVSAATGPFAEHGRIYRRPLSADGSLTPARGLPEWTQGIADTGCIAAHGPCLAIAGKAGIVYQSSDFGQTWFRRTTKLPAPSGLLLL